MSTAVDTPTMSWPARLGVLLWLVQPLYLVAEFVTAAKVIAPYSLAGNTISDLGAEVDPVGRTARVWDRWSWSGSLPV